MEPIIPTDTFFVFWKFVMSNTGRFYALYCENLQFLIPTIQYEANTGVAYNCINDPNHDCWRLPTPLTRVFHHLTFDKLQQYIHDFVGGVDNLASVHTLNVWLSDYTPTVAFTHIGDLFEHYANRNPDTHALYKFNIKIQPVVGMGERYHVYTLNPRPETQSNLENPDIPILAALRRTTDTTSVDYSSTGRIAYFLATREEIDKIINNRLLNYQDIFPFFDFNGERTTEELIHHIWR